jgi:hypothetical protein
LQKEEFRVAKLRSVLEGCGDDIRASRAAIEGSSNANSQGVKKKLKGFG